MHVSSFFYLCLGQCISKTPVSVKSELMQSDLIQSNWPWPKQTDPEKHWPTWNSKGKYSECMTVMFLIIIFIFLILSTHMHSCIKFCKINFCSGSLSKLPKWSAVGFLVYMCRQELKTRKINWCNEFKLF